MREPKFDIGDVVRINHGSFKENDGTLATVKSVRQTDGSPYDVLKLETVGGWRLEVWEYMVVGVSLEEVQRYYADKPRRGFIVDGLTVDELESGQDEAYEIFQQAAKDAEYCERVQKDTEETYNRIRRSKLYRKRSDACGCVIGFAITTFVQSALWILLWLEGYLDWNVSLAGVGFTVLMAVYAAHHMVWLIKGINSEIERIDSENDGIT